MNSGRAKAETFAKYYAGVKRSEFAAGDRERKLEVKVMLSTATE